MLAVAITIVTTPAVHVVVVSYAALDSLVDLVDAFILSENSNLEDWFVGLNVILI